MKAVIFRCRVSGYGSKRLRFFLMPMFSMIFCVSLFAQDIPDMFPDSIGNYWQYEYSLSGTGIAGYKSITDTITINRECYFIIESRTSNNVSEMFLRKDSVGNIWQYYQNCNEEVLWFDFSMPDSAVYHWQVPGGIDSLVDSFNVRVYHPLQIETPAGTFENCTGFFFDIPGAFDDEEWYVFAPNVGIVEEQGAWRPHQLLSSAFINGKLITVVNQETEIASRFILDQNFPNPFNPSTIIRFTLPNECFVTIKILDVLGREVATFANDKMDLGQHQITWKPIGLPNGVYFYRLKTDDFVETKKMIFLE